MKKWLLFLVCLLTAIAVLGIRLQVPAVQTKTESGTKPKVFADTPVGSEYAWNRDGYIVKISDRIAVMKLFGEEDELILVTDPYSADFQYTVLDKAEVVRWKEEDGQLILTVSEKGKETERAYDLTSLLPQ